MKHHTVTLSGARFLRGLGILWLVVWAWPLTQESETKGLWHRGIQVFVIPKLLWTSAELPDLARSGFLWEERSWLQPFRPDSAILWAAAYAWRLPAHPPPALLSGLELTPSTHPRSHSTLCRLQLYQVGLHTLPRPRLAHWHPPWYSKVNIRWRAWVKGPSASLQGAGESLEEGKWWSGVKPGHQGAAGRNHWPKDVCECLSVFYFLINYLIN